jgi:hypothetical protein
MHQVPEESEGEDALQVALEAVFRDEVHQRNVMYCRGEDVLLRTHPGAATVCYEKGQEAMLATARSVCFYESVL